MSRDPGSRKVAIVHDWLIGGGAELVVQELHRMFPDAPIYTSYATDEWRQKLDNKVVTGYLQNCGKLRKFVPFLRQHWFSHLDLSGYDLVISSSGAEAKGIRVDKGATHVNYCHAPTHYYWSRYDEYLENPGFGALNWAARLGLKLLVGPLRRWDYKAAQRPDYLIANSGYIKDQIKKYYGREAVVIHPPVPVERFAGSEQKRHGFVVAGRQTPYKRFDLAVQACSQLNLPLTVLGKGPDHARLVSLAGPTITFIEQASDKDMEEHFQKAEGFIFGGLDDFGIVAVEAMAAGTPVIAYQDGGALDYVMPDKTGVFFKEQTVGALAGALQEFQQQTFQPKLIKEAAQDYSPKHFQRQMKDYLHQLD